MAPRPFLAVITLCASSAAAESGFVDVPGGRIAWERGGRGAPVVLIHDGLLPMASWDDVIAPLRARFDVVRWDRRGYGASTTTTRDYASEDDLLALLDRLELPRAALVGCSSGGGLALDFTILHPDRVSALVLEGPVLSGFPYSAQFLTRNMRNGAPSRMAKDDAATLRRWAEDPYITDVRNVGARRRLRALLERHPESATNKVLRSSRREFQSQTRLGEVKVPVRLVTGESDIPDVHAHMGAIEAGLARAERIVVAQAGHLVHLEQPEVFVRLLEEFLDPRRMAKELLAGGLGKPAVPAMRALFDYDAAATLDLQERGSETRGAARVRDISFAGPAGVRAPAFLVEPAASASRDGSRAGLVFLHHGQGDRSTFLDEAVALAERDVVSLLLEAPQNRPEAGTTIFDPGNERSEIAQTVVELRRAFDLLVARADVDPQRLGYVGWSLGATMGARLAGVELRPRAFVMMAGWASYSRPARDGHGVFGAAFRGFLTPEAQAAWLAAIEPIDGTHLMDGRSPILLQFALRDPHISALDAALYREAAGPQAESREYDVGHFALDTGDARHDREEWLARQLALTPREAAKLPHSRRMTMQPLDLPKLIAEHRQRTSPWQEFFRVPDLSLGIYRLLVGAQDEQSPHEEDEIYYVLGGHGRIRIGDEDHAVDPGDVVYVAKRVEHRFHDITEELELLVFFAPAEGSADGAGGQAKP